MCFSPKVKIPKQDPSKISAPTPAPLAEQVQGVQFGADPDEDDTDTKETGSSEVKSAKRSGKSSLRVSLSKSSGGGAKKVSIKSKFGK